MTEHTPLRAAAIADAARQAGAIDPNEIVALIPANELMNAQDAVAALKCLKPHCFMPKHARDMTPAERAETLRKLGVHHTMSRTR
jgi:hypothetical protein